MTDSQGTGSISGISGEGFRQVAQFHENPAIVSRWIKLTGPLLRWLTPSRRRLLLALGAIVTALKYAVKGSDKIKLWSGASLDFTGSFLVVAIIFGFLYLCYRAAQNFGSLPLFIRKNPQLSLHSSYWMLLIVLWLTPAYSGLWRIIIGAVAIKLSFFLWRLGYMFMAAKRGKMAGTGFKDHLMYLWPFYGGSNTPYGKGFEYLSRNEAKDEESLARSQLAGIKLLLLSLIWDVVMHILDGFVFGTDNLARRSLGFSLNVPHLKQLVTQAGTAPVGISWASLYFELIRDVLRHAISGHQIIGTVRLFGFNVFRNTYKPLLSKTVVEFWNRYYYYFKEVMVEFFFYPTFANWFKKRPKLRLLAAVFMAAFVGNTYYHFMGKMEYLAYNGLYDLGTGAYNRMFYCFLLSIGIYVSMLREQKKAAASRTQTMFRRILAIFGVWTFFSIIHIWNQGVAVPFVDLLKFFFRLFGFA